MNWEERAKEMESEGVNEERKMEGLVMGLEFVRSKLNWH